uniref:Uncharacterized protein n=1 Tax=Anguilla anguilla TaxID=7936 RepID=A0A0E9WSB3_ANGAN
MWRLTFATPLNHPTPSTPQRDPQSVPPTRHSFSSSKQISLSASACLAFLHTFWQSP